MNMIHIRPARSCILGAIGLTFIGSGLAAAQIPDRPAIDSFATVQFTTAPSLTIARIALQSGSVRVFDPARKKVQSAAIGLELAPEYLIQTGGNARCRVVFNNGDILHIGPNALLALDQQDHERTLELWQGEIMAYAMPYLEGRKSQWVVETALGNVVLVNGKSNIGASDQNTRVAVFDNTAIWSDADGKSTPLASGQSLSVSPSGQEITRLAPGFETEESLLLSPEVPALQEGLQAFRENDVGRATAILKQVQAAFPYNGSAAYYLGLIHLNEGDLKETIEQWQHYVRVNPKEAKEKKVPRYLTVIIGQHLKEQARYAVANEEKISGLAPTPNSIAVHPMKNSGNEKYQAIGKGLTAMVIADLTKVPGLKVLEREKIQRMLDEISLSESGLVQQDTTVRSGRLLRAEKLVIGDFNIQTKDAKN